MPQGRQGGDLRSRQSLGPLPTALPVPARVIVIDHHGDACELDAVSTEIAPPGPGEVRLRQRAVGVNFFDIYLRRGWIPGMPRLPGVLGIEAAAT